MSLTRFKIKGTVKELLQNEFPPRGEKENVTRLITPFNTPTLIGPFNYVNLSKNTKYRVFYNDLDVTKFCKPLKSSVGLVGKINNTTLISDKNGKLSFNLYWGSWNKTPSTDLIGKLTQAEIIDKFSIYLVPAVVNLQTEQVTINNITLDRNLSTNPTVDLNNNRIEEVSSFVFDYDYQSAQYITQKISPNFIQTFFVDPNSANSSKVVDISSVNLYFKSKPIRNLTKTTKEFPGVIVAIVDIENGKPVTSRQYNSSRRYLEYNDINTSTDSTVSTTFEFENAVRLKTGRYYGIAIIFDDDYQLWSCKKGDRIIGTNTPSPGSTKDHRGVLFTRSNSTQSISTTVFDNVFVEKDDTDLKFEVFVNQYETDDLLVNLVNADYEFLTVSGITGQFFVGEYVYQQTANSTGTISINQGNNILTGVGTSFTTALTTDDLIVITDGSTVNTEIMHVDYIISNTQLVTKENSPFTLSGKNYKIAPIAVVNSIDLVNDKLILIESNAKTGKVFSNTGSIIGTDSGATCTIVSVDEAKISSFLTDLELAIPSSSDVRGKFNFTYDDGSYRISNSSTFETELDLYDTNDVTKYESLILSKSLEVANPTFLYDSDGDSTGDKSLYVAINYKYLGTDSTTFESPVIDTSYFNLKVQSWNINNDTTNEHTNSGNALSKHISKKLKLVSTRVSEDIRVIQNVYKPAGTNVKVYAKILNANDPQPFDDKSWTELSIINSSSQFSSLDNKDDLIEIEYGFPRFPPSSETLVGVVDTDGGNTEVVGTGTLFEIDLAEGDIIKIYNPINQSDYGIFSVQTINSNTSIILSSSVSNTNIQDTGLKIDKLATPYTAFNNSDNLNIVRYFDTNGVAYDGYSVVAIKTVFLSSSQNIIPYVDDVRVISLSV
jgi:hypothetical protein